MFSDSSFQNFISAVLATSGTGIISYLLYKFYTRKNYQCDKKGTRSKYRCPRYETRRSLASLDLAEWEVVGRVKKLWIYPVKSCRGVRQDEVTADKLGPKYHCCRDRCLVIIDEHGEMITGRKISSTLLITPQYDVKENILTLEFPHLQPMKIYLSLVEVECVIVEVKLWVENAKGLDCGDEVADWLTLALGKRCRLLYHGNLSSDRSTSYFSSPECPFLELDDTSLYADIAGYMLMSEQSFVDVKSRVKDEIYIENFRPNILVEGCEAYDEDVWTYIKIGEAVFRNIRPCTRCIMTTIDFSTGKRNQNTEPLKTLRSYRSSSSFDSPLLGIEMGIDRVSQIKEGDNVSVLRN